MPVQVLLAISRGAATVVRAIDRMSGRRRSIRGAGGGDGAFRARHAQPEDVPTARAQVL